MRNRNSPAVMPRRPRAGFGWRHFAATVVGLAALGPTNAADWKELGPAPISNGSYTGRVSALLCSPTDQDRYFVAGADGGVWRTTDGGSSWTPLTGSMPTTSIGAMAFDPTDENVIYAGTGEANFANHSRYGLGLLKSTDGGNSWTLLAADTFSGRCFSRILVSPQDSQVVYAAITQAGGFPEKAAAKKHPQRDGPYGVFRSRDGGETWEQLTNGLPNLSATDLTMGSADPSILVAGIGHIFGSNDNGLYKSTDGGDSWTKITGGGFPASTNIGRISVQFAPSDDQRLYTLVTRKATSSGGNADTLGGYRSNNEGANWTSINVGSIQATYGWYLSFVLVAPSDPAVAFFGGFDLVRTTNSGGAFQTVTPPHVDMHAGAFDAAGRLVVGDDGGVHRSANRGTSWTSLNKGLGVTQIYAALSTHPTNDDIVLIGLQDNGTNIRKKDELTWTSVLGGDGGWTLIDPKNGNRMFAQYQGTGNIFRSTDGGNNFNQASSGINAGDRNAFYSPLAIDPANSQRMLAATHRIYRSTNGGTSWSSISGDLTNGGTAAIRSLAIAPSDSNIVYAATNDSRVLASENGGANWTLIASDADGWPRTTREIFVHPTNADTVYLAGATFGSAQIRRSTDRGQSWTPLDAQLPDTPVNTVSVDVRGGKPVLFAGSDDGLRRSVDDGASWHRYGKGLPNVPVIDLRLEVDRGRIVAATQGRGAWSIAVALPGDLNGDGAVNFDDIDPFVLALSNPTEFGEQYPNVDPNLAGDLDGDGELTFNDIDPFVVVLGG